jgi:hypothetical protein
MIEQLARRREPDRPTHLPALQKHVLLRLMSRPTVFCVLVLSGEEIPDLFQKLAPEHRTRIRSSVTSTATTVRKKRGTSTSRILLPELWAHASRSERFQVRHFAPRLLEGMFDMLVHPGVYEVVGLPGWPTWRAAKATPARLDLKHRALRPVAQALIDAGALVPGRIPTRWQRVCGIDRSGRPVA